MYVGLFSLLACTVLDLPVFQTSVDYYATAVEDYLAQLVEILGGSTEAYADVLPQVVRYLRQAVELLQLAQPSPLPPPSGSATPVASSPDHTGEDHSDPSPAGSVDQEAVAGEPATPPPQLAAPPPAVVARQRRRRRIAGGDAGAEAGPSTRRPRSGRVCAVCVSARVCMLVCILQAVGTGSTRSSQPTAQPAHAGGYIWHYTEGERGEMEVTWVSGSCHYGGPASDMATCSAAARICARCLLGGCAGSCWSSNPIPLCGALLDKATKHCTQPDSMDPSHPGFLKEACKYIRTLLLESNLVETHAQRKIGLFLEELGRLPAVSATDLRRCICNQAAEEKNRLYCRIRDLCATNGCSACQAASRAPPPSHGSSPAEQRRRCAAWTITGTKISPGHS